MHPFGFLHHYKSECSSANIFQAQILVLPSKNDENFTVEFS